jgi:membrane-associated phospholipid phosphatase
MITPEVIDRGAIHALGHFKEFLPAARPVIVGLVYLGSLYAVAGITLVASAGLLLRGQHRAALLLLCTVGLALGLSCATQMVVARDRPNIGWAPVEPLDQLSFPSSNALMSAALFGSLALLLAHRTRSARARGGLRAGGILLPFLLGVACLLAGHNFVTDVLAGWAGGASLALACAWVDQVTTPAVEEPAAMTLAERPEPQSDAARREESSTSGRA